MTYRDVLARSERLRPDGTPVWPLGFSDRPRAAVARQGQDPQGLGAQHDIASRKGAPNTMRGAL